MPGNVPKSASCSKRVRCTFPIKPCACGIQVAWRQLWRTRKCQQHDGSGVQKGDSSLLRSTGGMNMCPAHTPALPWIRWLAMVGSRWPSQIRPQKVDRVMTGPKVTPLDKIPNQPGTDVPTKYRRDLQHQCPQRPAPRIFPRRGRDPARAIEAGRNHEFNVKTSPAVWGNRQPCHLQRSGKLQGVISDPEPLTASRARSRIWRFGALGRGSHSACLLTSHWSDLSVGFQKSLMHGVFASQWHSSSTFGNPKVVQFDLPVRAKVGRQMRARQAFHSFPSFRAATAHF